MKEPQMKINLRIIPFGHAIIEIRGREEIEEVREKEVPVYVKPERIIPQFIRIYIGEENYTVLKNTEGLI